MRGFTLIELLVVVLIIALGVSVVSLNVGDESNRRLQIEAKQFANEAVLLHEEAVLSNRPWGIDFYRLDEDGEQRFGYRWLVRSDQGQWEKPLDQKLAEEMKFSPGLGLRLQLDGLDTETEIEYRQEVSVQQQNDLTVSDSDRPGLIGGDNKLTQQQPVKPEVWLISSGEMNAFALTVFSETDPDTFLTIKADELGRVWIDRGEVDDNAG